jgi:hypothetical protein
MSNPGNKRVLREENAFTVAPPFRACPERSRWGGTCRAKQAAEKRTQPVILSSSEGSGFDHFQ